MGTIVESPSPFCCRTDKPLILAADRAVALAGLSLEAGAVSDQHLAAAAVEQAGPFHPAYGRRDAGAPHA